MLNQLWQIYYISGLIFIVAIGQILKNNLTIWSHWLNGRTWDSTDVREKRERNVLVVIDVIFQTDPRSHLNLCAKIEIAI